jgi:hypothetical protein
MAARGGAALGSRETRAGEPLVDLKLATRPRGARLTGPAFLSASRTRSFRPRLAHVRDRQEARARRCGPALRGE